MTKGKMILELLTYAKSVIKKFDQSEASIVVMWLPKMFFVIFCKSLAFIFMYTLAK